MRRFRSTVAQFRSHPKRNETKRKQCDTEFESPEIARDEVDESVLLILTAPQQKQTKLVHQNLNGSVRRREIERDTWSGWERRPQIWAWRSDQRQLRPLLKLLLLQLCRENEKENGNERWERKITDNVMRLNEYMRELSEPERKRETARLGGICLFVLFWKKKSEYAAEYDTWFLILGKRVKSGASFTPSPTPLSLFRFWFATYSHPTVFIPCGAHSLWGMKIDMPFCHRWFCYYPSRTSKSKVIR